MQTSVKRALTSMTQALMAVTDHVSGADIVRNEQRAQRRMAARIEALRAGFGAIRERHDRLSGKISQLGRHRV